MARYKVLMPFSYSADGITKPRLTVVDEEISDLSPDEAPGLIGAEYIEEVEVPLVAPEDAAPVDIDTLARHQLAAVLRGLFEDELAGLSEDDLRAKIRSWHEGAKNGDEGEGEGEPKVIATLAEHPVDDFDAMSDDELRAYIETRDGTAPHHAMGRNKLLATARGE